MSNWKEHLSSIYFSVGHPGSYTGPETLYGSHLHAWPSQTKWRLQIHVGRHWYFLQLCPLSTCQKQKRRRCPTSFTTCIIRNKKTSHNQQIVAQNFVVKKVHLRDQQIHHFYALNTETKANYSERLIKTLKHKLFRYIMKNRTERYVDVLQDVVHGYNHTVHRSLGDKPSVITKAKEGEIVYNNTFWDNLTPNLRNSVRKTGDTGLK